MAKWIVSTANLTGDKALDHALTQFPIKFVNKFVKKQMRQAMKDIVLRDAIRTTPVDEAGDHPGQLRSSLKIRAAKNRKGGRLARDKIGFAVVAAKTTKIDAYYAKFVFMDARNRKGSGKLKRADKLTAAERSESNRGGQWRRGTRTLRNALFTNSRALLATLIAKLKHDLPKLAREVHIDSLRYKG